MTAAFAGQASASAHLVSDTAFLWIETVMVVIIVVALICGHFLRRSNKRLHEETQRLLERRRAEADSAEANSDALAGRPQQLPLNGADDASR